MTTRKWKAAVSQAEPCWLDKVAGVAKTISLIREAKSNDAALIAFAELWLPGYPIFLCQGEEVHIAAWPNNRMKTGAEPWSISMQASEVLASQMYAIEGQTWVLCTNSPVSQKGIEMNLSDAAVQSGKRWQREAGGGAAAVYGPDGRLITPRMEATFDGLIYCDVDLDKVLEAKTLADPVGHYSRPDLLRLLVDDEPKQFFVKAKSAGESVNGNQEGSLLSRHKPLRDIIASQA